MAQTNSFDVPVAIYSGNLQGNYTTAFSGGTPAAPIATSAVMLIVGLLACVEPARRALRIQPTDALKET